MNKPTNLKRNVVESILWMGTSSLVSQAVTWIVTIFVARILMPADYGLVALAGIYIGFTEYVNEFGIGTAIIQAERLDETDIRSMYSISLIIGAIMTAVTLFIAPFVAAYFNEEKLILIIRVLSITFLISSARSVQRNLMIREMKFSLISRIEMVTRIVTSVVALACALYGMGAWTLVVQYLLQNLLGFVGSAWYERRLPGAIRITPELKKMLSFGFGIMNSKILFYCNRSADSFLVGTLLGKTLLGYYTFALMLADKPFEKIVSLLHQVFFPMFAKMQNDPERLKTYLLRIMEIELLILSPIFLLIALTSDNLVLVMLGNKWESAILPLQVFSFIGFFKYFENVAGMVLTATGRARAQVVYVSLLFPAMAAGIYFLAQRYHLNGVLIAWCAIFPLLSCMYFARIVKLIDISFKEMASIFKLPFGAASVMVIMVLLVSGAVQTGNLNMLTIKIIMGIGTYLLVMVLLDKEKTFSMVRMLQIRKADI